MALREEREFDIEQRLSAPADLGLPRPQTLSRLLKNERPEVRRAAALALSHVPEGEAVPNIEGYYDDPDVEVKVWCLRFGADRGDREALLVLYELWRSTEPEDPEHGSIATILSAGRFREAGDDFAARLTSATGKLLGSYVSRLEGLLRTEGFVELRGIEIDGAFVSWGVNSPLGEEKTKKLAKALADRWQEVRMEYRSIHDFEQGDRIYPPDRFAPGLGGVGKRALRQLLVISEGVWTAGFWVAALVVYLFRSRARHARAQAEKNAQQEPDNARPAPHS